MIVINGETYMTVHDAASMLNVSMNSMYQWLRRHKTTVTRAKVGYQLLVRKSDLSTYERRVRQK